MKEVKRKLKKLQDHLELPRLFLVAGDIHLSPDVGVGYLSVDDDTFRVYITIDDELTIEYRPKPIDTFEVTCDANNSVNVAEFSYTIIEKTTTDVIVYAHLLNYLKVVFPKQFKGQMVNYKKPKKTS